MSLARAALERLTRPWHAALAATVALALLMLLPNPLPDRYQTLINLLHVPTFALLGLIWRHSFSRAGLGPWTADAATLGVLLALAAGSEGLQQFIPGRYADLADAWRDLIGAAIALILARIIPVVDTRSAQTRQPR